MDDTDMPQPLSKLKASSNYIFGNDVLTTNPELGALVSSVIAGWAITEAHLGNAFAELIGAKQPITVSMYSALHTFEAQRALLQTAAEEILPKTSYKIFAASLVIIGREAATRHRFAHWIWGRSTDPGLSTEALFLVEPKHFWHLRVRRIKAAKKAQQPMSLASIHRWAPIGVEPKHIYVYRKNDLEEACSRMDKAYRQANVLVRIISSRGAVRRQLQNLLKAQPEIQTQLSKMNEAGKSSPRSSRKSHRK